MKFRILGSLQVDGPNGQPLQLEPRQTRLLATLLLAANHVVTRSRLIEAVWDDDPPDTVDRQLKNLVSALRRRLATAGSIGQVDFDSTGYRVTVDVHELDASVFVQHLSRADALRSDGHVGAAAQQLRVGLALWRGPALDGCAARTVEAAALRLNEQRMAATEQCLDLELQLGRHRDLVGEVTELAAAYPLRERLVGQLMLALYRSGRQADALNAYQRLRDMLGTELGCDPSRELQDLHTAILRNDPAASAPPPHEDTTRGGTTQTRRRMSVRHIVGHTALLKERAGLASRTAPPSAASPTVTCTLPGDMAAFTGRSDYLEKIVAEAQAVGHEGRVAAVYAINGMPGVGKTALAVHLGHMLKCLFPDRQLFLDLHAHTIDQVPVDPHKALAHLLTADGVDARYLPDDTDGRTAMWRDRMAGRRILLILDNATDSRQVAPLIPDTTGSLVLVTSRRYLGDLPQVRVTIPLELLPPDEAVQVFVRLAPPAQDASPAVVRELVGLCGRLPLAISILASIYTKHPSWTVEDLLREARSKRLDAAAENLSVARTFGLSYQYLSVDEQRLFRYLGMHPGVEFDPYAAATLAGLPVEAASDLLDQLHSAGLLIESAFRRYRMHDLLRYYASALALDEASDDREGVLGRLLDYYQHCAKAADAQLVRHARPGPHPAVPGPPAAPDVSQRAWARAWIRAELPNLLACIAYAECQNMPERAIDLTAAVAAYLRTDGPWDLAIDLHTNAVTSAEHLGDRSRTAGALHHLGVMLRLTNEYPAAVTALQQALDLYHGLDDPQGQANTIHELGIVWRLTQDLPSATTAVQQALAQYRDLGDRLGQANALYELAVLQGMTGDFPAADTTARQAQDIYRSIDDQHGYANTLNIIGAISRETGDFRTATASLQDASDLYRDIDDRLGQANAMMELGVARRRIGELLNAATLLEQAYDLCRGLGSRHGQAIAILELGIVRRQTGDLAAATTNTEEALRIYQDLGSQNGQAHALLEQGTLYRISGSLREAVTTLQEAHHLARDLGHRPGEAEILQELGLAQAQAGDTRGGTAKLKQALDLFRDLGNRHGEVEALNHTGVLHLAHGDASQSRVYHQRALELARTIVIPMEEARALEGIARCALALGEPETATSHLRQALQIYQRIGAGDALRLATELQQGT